MGRCEICKIGEEEVRLFDGINDGQMVLLCERCSIIENIPIIRKPNSEQLKESEQNPRVFERMKRLSGIQDQREKETLHRGARLKELEKNPQLALPQRDQLNLIENFHWEVMKSRRRKGLSHKQFAQAIGESETALQMIEKGTIPQDAQRLIKKIEQFFQIRLKKMTQTERFFRTQRPTLRDQSGNELDLIPEEIVSPKKEKEREREELPRQDIAKEFITEKGVKEFDIRSHGERATIGDLQKIHKKKIEVTRQEQVEEQKKIEERKRLLLALRERDRLRMEQKKKKELEVKQRQERENQRLVEEREKRLRELRQKEARELDRHLGGKELLEKGKNNPEKQNTKSEETASSEFDDALF